MRGGLKAEKPSAEKLATAAMVVLVLITFALYAHTLDNQSLWFDEGLSVIFSSRPLPRLINTLVYEDLHPPFYYLLLHFWMILAGSSEWAVRLPSALAAVLLIPLTFSVVQEVWGKSRAAASRWTMVGVAAAALVGSSPFMAFYAQETRMYSLAAALSLATAWAFLRATRTGASRHWFLFACLLAASLYTQYFAAFIVPAFLIYVLVLDHRSIRPALISLLLAGLFCLPWLRPAYLQVGRLLRSPDYWVGTRINPVLFLHAIWNTLLPSLPKRAAMLGVALVLALLIRFLTRKRLQLPEWSRRSMLVLLTALIPLALTYIAVALAPKFVARYTIVAAAPLYICAALVLHAVLGHRMIQGRVLFSLLIGLAVMVSLQPMLAIVEGRENRRDDVRGLAAYLDQNAQPNDVLLLAENAPYALQYYYHGETPQYGLHVGYDFGHAANVLNEILRTRPRRVWLVLWHHEFADPTDMLVTELLRVGREVTLGERFLGYELRAFDIEDYDHLVAASPQPQEALNARFAPGLQLLGVDRFSEEDGQLHYVCYWQATKLLQHNYSLILSLQDAEGKEYLRKHQALCTDYFLPPAWPPNTPLRGRVDLMLPMDLPALPYRVYLSVFDPDSQRNVDLIDVGGAPVGQALFVEELFLPKSGMGKVMAEVRTSLQVDLGHGLEVLGFDMDRATYNQGDVLALTLWWRRMDMVVDDMSVQFRMMNSEGRTVWKGDWQVLPGYPPTQWQKGEVNRAVYHLAVPSDLASDAYHLQVGLVEKWTTLSEIRVEARTHLYDKPAIQYALDLPFEQGIALLGHDLSATVVRPGATVRVTLYWQPQQPITTSYKVSVQLLSPQLQLVAQDDSIPVHWTYPTTAWLPGEVIMDEHVLTVVSEAPPGRYSLIVLIYDPKSLRRLSVEQAGRTEDHATLNVLEIAP